jgi:sphingomyelin phosphodiesterase
VNKLYEKHGPYFNTKGRELIKVALMSDLHIDYDYTPGMSNSCGKPLCCRSDSGLPSDPSQAAGKWGDYNCDLNELTLKNLLSYINDEVKPDVVMWGGDSIPHNIDTLTFATNVQIMKNISAEVLTQLDGTRIYPTIGNHDTYP